MHYILLIALTLNGRFLESHAIEFDNQDACIVAITEYANFIQSVGDQIRVQSQCIPKGFIPTTKPPARGK